MRNKSHRILITGCSKGFGLMFARELAAADDEFHVIATARNLAQAEELKNAAERLDNLEVLPLDVTDESQVDAIVKYIENHADGELKVLINNAGYGLMGSQAMLNLAELRQQFETNVFAPVELTRRLLPALLPDGLVINISSIASYIGLPNFGAYSASKSALNSFSMALASENAAMGLSVVSVQPGPFETEFRSSVRKLGQPVSLSDSAMFPKREDPAQVLKVVRECIYQKLRGALKSYEEIPVGTNSNIFRLMCRWLPKSLIVRIMSRHLAERANNP